MKIIPQADHLKVELSGTSEKEANWFTKDTFLRVEIYNGVPIIVFVCQDPADSFFIHLNIAELRNDGPLTWLEVDKLLLNFDFTDNTGKVTRQENVKVYQGGTKKIKDALLAQYEMTAEEIEDSVNSLYQADYNKVEWLKFPK